MTHVTTELDNRGVLVLIEPKQRKGLDRRVFREVEGGWEWAHLADWREYGSRARFYGWGSRELPLTMTAND